MSVAEETGESVIGTAAAAKGSTHRPVMPFALSP